MKRYCQIKLIIIASLLVLQNSVFAKPVVKPLRSSPECGLSVYAFANPKKYDQLLAYSEDTEKQFLHIDLGKGVEFVDLVSASEDTPEKIADAWVLIFKNQNTEVKFDLISKGPCGDEPEFAKNDSCEYISFVGNMTVKTSDGTTAYSVIANDGC